MRSMPYNLKQEVEGSIPSRLTIKFNGLRALSHSPFFANKVIIRFVEWNFSAGMNMSSKVGGRHTYGSNSNLTCGTNIRGSSEKRTFDRADRWPANDPKQTFAYNAQ